MKDARYERHKKQAADRSRRQSRAGREIGEIPPVRDSKRKERGRRAYRDFCELYFPQRFYLAWSPNHLAVIERIETAVVHGGRFAIAMSRGDGKTSLCETAALWALLYGFHAFVFLVGASAEKAGDLLRALKTELETNELLLADFPEVCYPIRALEGEPRRCKGQLHHGRPTRMFWGDRRIVLPSIPGSRASEGVVAARGLTGNIRGPKYVRQDGRNVRPRLAILDDPQTEAAAKSQIQCEHREKIITGAVLGLAGPGEEITALMPCTVIEPGDLADSFTDRQRHPEWQGIRTKMLVTFPTNMGLWQHYAKLRQDSFRSGGRGEQSTEFYRTNREAMDAGAEVAWPERYSPDELSAIQHAMNLWIDDPQAFFREYQNDPQSAHDDDLLDADAISRKTHRLERRLVPADATVLTAFVDVQKRLLYYAVVATAADFTEALIDYGAWPDQRRPYFTLRDARPTIQTRHKGHGFEAALYASLDALVGELLDREWPREGGGGTAKLELALIDANWGESTDIVYTFVARHPHRTRLLPSHGRFIGAAGRPMHDWEIQTGEIAGDNWRVRQPGKKRTNRYALFDTNHWKSFVHARLAVATADRGSLTLFEARPDEHRMIAEHLSAEFRVKTQGRGRTVYEWQERPDRENHLFDCVVGASVAASMRGCKLGLPNLPAAAKQKKRRRKVAYL